MCSHYSRNIEIKCEVCNIFSWCHKCHDENSNHEFIRSNLKTIKCKSCDTIQYPSNESTECIKCNEKYSKFSCIKCSYFGNEDTIHCDVCRVCIYKKNSNHKCIPDFISEKCSICISLLSTDNVLTLVCGHHFHTKCIANYTKKCETPTCPLCRSLFGNKTNFCNYCKETFYGNPRGTMLDCGHYFHMRCLKYLPALYYDEESMEKNMLHSVECSKSDCRRRHTIKYPVVQQN